MKTANLCGRALAITYVLDWILERCEDNVDARETPIGYLPYVDDINAEGLNIERETLEKS